MYRHEYDHDLGHDFIGRTLKDCVGSPPSSLLDKRHWNETTNDYPFNANLVIDDMIARIREDPNDGTTITVVCKSLVKHKAMVNILANVCVMAVFLAMTFDEERKRLMRYM